MAMTVAILFLIVVVLSALNIIQYIIPLLFFGAFVYTIIKYMGTGNKKRPDMLRVSDLYETSVCPLARIMRKECRKRGIDHLKVVWSPEEPVCHADEEFVSEGLHPVPGSTAFVPGCAGLMIAAEVVNDLTGAGLSS